MPQNPDAVEDPSESEIVADADRSAVNPSSESERPYPALTPEEKRRVLSAFKRFLDEGLTGIFRSENSPRPMTSRVISIPRSSGRSRSPLSMRMP
jgi:hypothetical protein